LETAKELERTIPEAMRSELYEERRVESVNTCMGIAENHMGRIFFPTLNSDFDYKGFTVTGQLGHTFCKDLFTYYWNQAESAL
jgi:hypothetical protein